jgi:hypothetical protein
LGYRKIILYIVVLLVALGYWYKVARDEKRRLEQSDRFAAVYAGTAVMAELHRNEPDRFFRARDSIYRLYHVDYQWIGKFRRSHQDREEDWSVIWDAVKRKTDSLVEYFKLNPVKHDTTKVLETDSSVVISDTSGTK